MTRGESQGPAIVHVEEIGTPVSKDELPASSLGHTVSNAIAVSRALSA
jgi:hypothetical protein